MSMHQDSTTEFFKTTDEQDLAMQDKEELSLESFQEEIKIQETLEEKDTCCHLTDFQKQFEQLSLAEEKIALCFDFMRAALSESGSARFKDFWEVRKACLPCFKEPMNPKSRVQLWQDYLTLSSEARHLKEILDEESAFATEQIELAILALEKDITQYDTLVKQMPEIAFPEACHHLMEKKELYNQLQKELHLLNAFASRIHSLRREVIKTQIRIRHKNALFEKLSLCGDRAFPKRKELIKQISLEFMQDVEAFVRQRFKEEVTKAFKLFGLREEIKGYQAIAKLLTLNTQSFTQTRLQLSECWDQVKAFEKERKKETLQKKQVFKQNYELVLEKIKFFAEQCEKEPWTQVESRKHAEEILSYMRTLELGREEVSSLKNQIFSAQQGILDRARQKEEERGKQEQEKFRQKLEKINHLKTAITDLIKGAEDVSIEQLIAAREEMLEQVECLTTTKAEKLSFERLFKQLKDVINEKKEKAAFDLSADDYEALGHLQSALNQRKEQRQEIKNQLENCRKVMGGSGLDFEKAMMYQEMIETEKMRLEKANAAIEEIEEKIAQLEIDES